MTGFSARWVSVIVCSCWRAMPRPRRSDSPPSTRSGSSSWATPTSTAGCRSTSTGTSCVFSPHAERPRRDDRADVPPDRHGSRRIPLAVGIPQVLPAEARRRGVPGPTPRRRSRPARPPPTPPSRPSRSSSSRRRSGPSWRRNAESATRAPPRSCGAGSGSTAGRLCASGATPARRSCPATPTRACSSRRSATATTSFGCPPRRSSPTRSSPTSRRGSRWARPTPGPGRRASRRGLRSISRRGGSSGRSGRRRSPPRRP